VTKSRSKELASVPSRNSVKASFVGANTVKGPSPERVFASPASTTKYTKVVNSGLPTALSTMVLLTQDGIRTSSIAWITPLLASTSARITSESELTKMPSSFTVKDSSSPFRAVAARPSVTPEEGTSTGST